MGDPKMVLVDEDALIFIVTQWAIESLAPAANHTPEVIRAFVTFADATLKRLGYDRSAADFLPWWASTMLAHDDIQNEAKVASSGTGRLADIIGTEAATTYFDATDRARTSAHADAVALYGDRRPRRR